MPAVDQTGFLGLSHLGIIASAGWAALEQRATGFDVSPEVVGQLQKGEAPIVEPGLSDLLQNRRGVLSFSHDLRLLHEFGLVVISRDVPTAEDNSSGLGTILELIDRAIPHLRQDVTLALMSQVPPGFTRQLSHRIKAARPELRFTLYYWMESLVFGNAVQRFLHPERLIVGCEDPRLPLTEPFRAGLSRFDCPIFPMSFESAELTKTAVNFYLAASVTYANTMADLCEATGANWAEIVDALRLDARIGPKAYIQPSLGVTGGNLERDLVTLRQLGDSSGVDTTLLDALIAHNNARYHWLLSRLRTKVFARVSQPSVAVWGLTYKKDTNSTKNSPALRLMAELAGGAEFHAWDPAVAPDGADQYEVLDGADALVIINDWDVFARADLRLVRERLRRPLIIDCSGILKSRAAEMHGLQYVAMGRACS